MGYAYQIYEGKSPTTTTVHKKRSLTLNIITKIKLQNNSNKTITNHNITAAAATN